MFLPGFGAGQAGGGPQFTSLGQAVRTMQIITGALLMGVVVFGVAATVVGENPAPAAPNQPPPTPMLTYMAAGFAFIQLGMRAVVPTVMARNAVAQMQGSLNDSDASKLRLAGVYQTKMIIGMALCEGAAFFALIAWMAERELIAIGTAAFLVLVMLTAFPTRSRVEGWIRHQLELRSFS